VYPFKQFSRALGSATLIDAPSTDTVGICLLEKKKGAKKKKKTSLVGPADASSRYKASSIKFQS